MAGFGNIMATVQMAREQAAREEAACPICGQPLANKTGGYFCAICLDQHLTEIEATDDAAYEYHDKGGVVTWADVLHPELPLRDREPDGSDWPQGLILAVATNDSGDVVGWMFTVRGFRGQTSIKVDMSGPDGVTPSGVAVNAATWHIAEWLAH